MVVSHPTIEVISSYDELDDVDVPVPPLLLALIVEL